MAPIRTARFLLRWFARDCIRESIAIACGALILSMIFGEFFAHAILQPLSAQDIDKEARRAIERLDDRQRAHTELEGHPTMLRELSNMRRDHKEDQEGDDKRLTAVEKVAADNSHQLARWSGASLLMMGIVAFLQLLFGFLSLKRSQAPSTPAPPSITPPPSA